MRPLTDETNRCRRFSGYTSTNIRKEIVKYPHKKTRSM